MTTIHPSMFATLDAPVADGLMALMLAYRADQRADKIDLGIGVYRDDCGDTPVMAAVKAAEKMLIEAQHTKVYIGVDGHAGFVDRLAEIPFGVDRARDPRLAGMQTPGGTGALRLAAELVATAHPQAKVWIGDPSWANHMPIFRAAGCEIQRHAFYRPSEQRFEFAAMLAALESATPHDAVLLHGCCHNPAGVDFTAEQWEALADIIVRRRLLPIVDLAYQGFGRGLEEDALGTRLLFDRAEALIVTYSCDKNFGLYRERTGALFVRAPDVESVPRVRTAMRNPARASWSMPPDHGAAVVRLILETPELTAMWRDELEAMRRRVLDLRMALAGAHPALAGLAEQTGMFSMLPVDRDAVMALRRDHGIYIADDGRVNIAGLRQTSLQALAKALKPLLDPLAELHRYRTATTA